MAGVGRRDGLGFDGRSAYGTEGPARRGYARGSDGVEGLRRREEAGVRVQLKREEDTVPPSGSPQPRGGT